MSLKPGVEFLFACHLRKVTNIEPCHVATPLECFVAIRVPWTGNITIMQSIYCSALNRDVKAAAPGEFPPIRIGQIKVWPPVVLAPMAGVTNYPFRSVCREFGVGLYVSEMINARPLVDGKDKTLKLADFGPGESPRSLQLYGTDPYYVAEAVKRLVDEGRIDHLDMNFG